ncbi:MAG: response regulator [Chloroflexi bacterium]|nr:response regulator [Chloroflexota bacterium]
MSDNRIVPVIRNLATGEVADWTVLIVDDEPDNRVIAEKVLSFNGAKVSTAENGRLGLAALETLSPSFILLDLSMPEMDGWEMLKCLRADSRWSAIPVIALTAHAMLGDRERVMQAGFDGYIAKPFRLSTFMAEILRCFRTLAGHQSS